jgi:hypothetical protein
MTLPSFACAVHNDMAAETGYAPLVVHPRLIPVHRSLAPLGHGDYTLESDGYVTVYPSECLLNNLPRGISCFLPPAAIHGFPDARIMFTKEHSECYVMTDLPPGFALVHDYHLCLRDRNGKNAGTAPHFCLVPVQRMTASEFEARAQHYSCWSVCSLRAATVEASGGSPDDSIPHEPWTSVDLDGVKDARIRVIYDLAQYFYPTSAGMLRIHLNDMMATIAQYKPTYDSVSKDLARVRDWHSALLAVPFPNTSSLQSRLGAMTSALADLLGIEDTEDHPSLSNTRD